MNVLIAALVVFASLMGVLATDFAQANERAIDSCDPPPEQPKKPPKK